jgi:hypothetical protein
MTEEQEYTFDLDTIEPAQIAELHQEGNYLVGLTDKGIKFRQHIPQGKILNKINGEYCLQDMIVREVAQ